MLKHSGIHWKFNLSTNEINRAINAMDTEDVDIVITEIGGTVGDIEGLPFLEAIRQFVIFRANQDKELEQRGG